MKKLGLLFVAFVCAMFSMQAQNVTLPYVQDFSSLTSGSMASATSSPTPVTAMPAGIQSVVNAYEANGVIRIGDTGVVGSITTNPIDAGGAAKIRVRLKYALLPETNGGANANGVLMIVFNGDTLYAVLDKLNKTWPLNESDLKPIFFELTPTSTPSTLELGTFVYPVHPETRMFMDSLSIEFVCLKPTNLVCTNTTDSSATISFTEPNNNVTAWQYVITHIETVTDPSTQTPIDITSNTGVVIPNLSSNTRYKVWVRSRCINGAYSDWSQDALTFKTGCEATSTITESFNSYTQMVSSSPWTSLIPDCWSKIPSGEFFPRMVVPVVTSYGNTSTVLSFSDSKPLYFVSPRIDTQLDGMLLRFKLNKENEDCGVFQVGYMSDPTDTNTFIAVASFNDRLSRYLIQKDVLFTNVPDNNGANRYIAFRYGNVNSINQSINSTYSIDDIEIYPAPQCTPVVKFEVDDVTAHTATLSFVSQSTATSWEYVFSNNLATNPNEQTSTVINTQTFTLSNLDASTIYGVWVRANCGNGEYSSWAFNAFKTDCGEVGRGWEENFSNYDLDNQIPHCWTRLLAYSRYPLCSGSAGYVSGTGLMFYMYGTAAKTTMMVSPLFGENLNQLQASFWLKSVGSNTTSTFEIGVMSNKTDTSTFIPIQQVSNADAYWAYHEVSLTAAPNTHRYLALRMKNPSGASHEYYFDDLKIDTLEACKRPSGLVIQSTTASSATLSFVSESGISAWQYAVTSNTYVQQPDQLTPVDITANPAVIDNLSANTAYRVWVRSNCGNGVYSKWSKLPVSFRTTCGDIEADYEDSFDQGNAADSNRPYCWNVVKPYTHSGTSYPRVNSGEGYLNNGAMELIIGGAVQNSSIIATPKFVQTDTLNQMAVSFWLKRDNVVDQSSFEVGVMSDVTDENTFIALHDVTPTTTEWTLYDVVLNQAPLASSYIAFRITQTGTTASPEYLLDDLYAYKTRSCTRPANLEVSNTSITANSADISWDPMGLENDWVVEYKTTASSQWTTTNANSSTLRLTALEPNTQYLARVKAVCTTTDESIWSYPIIFKTHCASEVLPFEEDFSTSSTTSFPPTDCWGVYKTKASDVFAGAPMEDGGDWKFADNQYGIVSKKAVINIYSTRKGWLVTPSIALQSNSALEFDVSYTKFNSNEPATTNGVDDIFMVVVSTDNGLTWSESNATVWSNDGNPTSNSLNGIPNTTQHYSISLAQYSGDIRIGFYAESTVSNTDNHLHIDNIKISQMAIVEPTVETLAATDITDATATLNKNVTEGTYPVTESGFWYWAVGNSNRMQSLNGNVTNLIAGTQYKFYAYAVADGTTYYGDTLEFSTTGTAIHPTVTTLQASNITTTTATLNKTVVADPSEPVLTEGWKYAKRGEETTWLTSIDGQLTGLEANTEYRFYAFATTAINSNGYTGDTLSFTTLQEPVGLEIGTHNAEIYPNPANSFVTVKVDGSESAYEIEISDIVGKIVGRYTMAQGANSIKIDVSALTEGNYLIRIVSGSKVRTERLIIKK